MDDKHEDRVAMLGRCVGRILGLEGEQLRTLEVACAFHDVGKLAIPNHIIFKPGPLTDDEYALVKTHSILGDQVMRFLNRPELAVIVRAHHERWDGYGYPDNLRGIQIPLESRIICVVDAYDAMISPRVYKPSRSKVDAILELERCADAQFERTCVRALRQVLGQ